MPDWTIFRWLLTATAAALIVACGGGGGGGGGGVNPAGDVGEVVIGITDAEGDFLKYLVDVRSIRLERANGDVVETIPLTTSIDFSELTQLTELLTIATVPAGTYSHIVMTLDYQNAAISVQEPDGGEVDVVAVDTSNNPLGVFDVRIRLPEADHVHIRAGVPAHVTLDFDLDASNTINLDQGTVTVQPFLLVVPTLDRDREHRVRGVLADVDEAASAITLKVRPFHHRNRDFGRFRFLVDEDTWYEIDGESYTGEAGLNAMARLEAGTPVVTLGAVESRQFTASAVVAGSSVPWADADVVRGVVTARDDDVLTVTNARLHFAGGHFDYRRVFTVTLTDDTTVTALGADGNLGKQAVSVGQRIVALGEFADDANLTARRVRMHMNQLTADVVTREPLMVNLHYLNGRRPDVFDFSGTGVTAADDANPSRYDIDTGTLNLPTIDAGSLVRVRGLVNDFGAAPPDFNARTVIDVDTDLVAAVLAVSWMEIGGTAMPFNSVAADRIDVDLDQARFVLKRRGVPLDTHDLASIALVAPGDAPGLYAVAVRGAAEVHLYRDFASLTEELVRQLEAGHLLTRIAAHGRYNSAEDELTTPRASFEFETP